MFYVFIIYCILTIILKILKFFTIFLCYMVCLQVLLQIPPNFSTMLTEKKITCKWTQTVQTNFVQGQL